MSIKRTLLVIVCLLTLLSNVSCGDRIEQPADTDLPSTNQEPEKKPIISESKGISEQLESPGELVLFSVDSSDKDKTDNLAEIIGEYNGKKVYDITHIYGIAYDEYVSPGGSMEFLLDCEQFAGFDDDDYLRIAIIPEPAQPIIWERVSKEHSIDLNGTEWYSWRTSDVGKKAFEQAEQEMTKSVLDKIHSFGWKILEDGDGGDVIRKICKAEMGSRYVVVLATKRQLKEFLPALSTVKTGGMVPILQADNPSELLDDQCDIHVFWAGMIYGLMDDVKANRGIITEIE